MAKEKPDRVIRSCTCSACQLRPQGPSAREHRALNRLVAATDERSRRLLVGFLSRQQGRGGIALLARITGLDRHTIARGQRELQQDVLTVDGRIRRPGAGCKSVEKK